jgi:hypothetical protein
MERFEIFPRRLRVREDVVLDRPDALDEVVDPLEALVAAGLEEGVSLFGVVEVGVVLPFDDEALEEGSGTVGATSSKGQFQRRKRRREGPGRGEVIRD